MREVESRFEPLKVCTACRLAKPHREYTKHKFGRDGLRPRCKSCTAFENAAYRARTVEQRAAYNSEYRRENRERRLIYNKAWNRAHRDRCDAATLRWRARNPEKVRAQRFRHRYLLRHARGAVGNYATDEKVIARLAYYGFLCAYCREAEADTIDHRIPLSRGGSHLPANLLPACRSCNSRKRTLTQREFVGGVIPPLCAK